jgi:hypothetical protein
MAITEEVIQVGGKAVAVVGREVLTWPATLVTKQPVFELLPLFVGFVKDGGLVIFQPFLMGKGRPRPTQCSCGGALDKSTACSFAQVPLQTDTVSPWNYKVTSVIGAEVNGGTEVTFLLCSSIIIWWCMGDCIFFNLPNPSGGTRPWGLLSL